MGESGVGGVRPLLVTGVSGLLGSNLALAARGFRGGVVGVTHSRWIGLPGVRLVSGNLEDDDEIRRLVKALQPAWIVHCAAATDVDWCERNPQSAVRINVDGSRSVAVAAREAAAGLVYISTDAVFSGDSGAYGEDDAPEPINVYGWSKLKGERAVADELERHLIVRTNMFGWSPSGTRSLAEWVVGKLEAGEDVPGFHDVRFNPLLVNDLAEAVLELVARGSTGVLHVASTDSMSKYEFARQVAEVFGYGQERVRRTSIEDAALPARRARDTTLLTARAAALLGRPMPTMCMGVERFRRLRDEGQPELLRSSLLRN